jgi:protein SCO1/2
VSNAGCCYPLSINRWPRLASVAYEWKIKMTNWLDKLPLTAQRERQEIANFRLSRREMVRASLLTTFVGVAATALAPFATASSGTAAKLPQSGAEWFTNVEVKTHDGRTLRFYDDVMKGKILLIDFMFTGCDGVCPLATENLARVQELLGDRVGEEIRMISISLQPEHDTPEVLAAYAKEHGVGPGWLFLTGQKDDIELLRHRLGFWDIDPAVDADPEQHIGTVRIANEPMHRWTMSSALVSPTTLVQNVNRVIPRFS